MIHDLRPLALILVLTGCAPTGGGTDTDADTDADTDTGGSQPVAFSFEGPVVGELGDDVELVVLWSVFASSPDRLYAYGTGAPSGASYSISFADAPPPAEALNDLGDGRRLGMGFLIALPPGTDVPEGPLADESVYDLRIGEAPGYAIVWREGAFDGPDELPWTANFPEGQYTCGACVETPDTFDIFEPVDCAEVELHATLGSDCNWS